MHQHVPNLKRISEHGLDMTTKSTILKLDIQDQQEDAKQDMRGIGRKRMSLQQNLSISWKYVKLRWRVNRHTLSTQQIYIL